MAKTVIGQQQQQQQDENYNWKGPDATRMSDTTSRHEVQETGYIMLTKLSPPQSKEKNKTLLINDWDNSSNGTTGEQAPPDLGTGQDTSATLCYYIHSYPIPSGENRTALAGTPERQWDSTQDEGIAKMRPPSTTWEPRLDPKKIKGNIMSKFKTSLQTDYWFQNF